MDDPSLKSTRYLATCRLTMRMTREARQSANTTLLPGDRGSEAQTLENRQLHLTLFGIWK